jgi:hypothetical protein
VEVIDCRLQPANWQLLIVNSHHQAAASRPQTVWVAREAVNRGPNGSNEGTGGGQIASATPQAAIAAARHSKPRSRGAGAPAVDVAQILKDR